jgi:N-glycosylase/DNA lyase
MPQVHKLCTTYGPLIAHVGEAAFHDLPAPQALTGDGVEVKLRELGFGYRAKYIVATARTVASKPAGWLDSLRNPEEPSFPPSPTSAKKRGITYKEAHRELLQLSGVGPKVADCVCLMGLGWAEAVPVDTHVWQIAQRDYKFGKGKAKTFSVGLYAPVGDFFRDLWGKEAGWAHSVLFTADLKTFADRLVKDETTLKVEGEASGVFTAVKDEENGREETVSRKRQRTLSIKTEGEPELKVSVVESVQGTSVAARRSARIREHRGGSSIKEER